MTRPPNIVVTLAVAVVAFGAIVLVKALVTPAPPAAWLTDEAAAFAKARREHKAVLIDLTASWSVPSVEVSRSLDALRPLIDRDFVALRIDVSNGDDTVRARYNLATIPAVVFVEPDGHVIERIVRVLDEREARAAVQAAARRRAH